MAEQIDILDAIYAEIQSVLSASDVVSVSDPADHTGLLQRHDRSTYPFVGIERFGGLESAQSGIGGDERVVDRNYDDNGYIESQVVRRKKGLTLEVAALEDDGDVRSASRLLTEVEQHFDAFLHEKDVEDIHADIHTFEYDGRNDASRPGDGVVGERLRYRLVYVRDRTVDVTPMDTIELQLEDTDSDTTFHDLN